MYKLHSDRDFEFIKESANELHDFDVKSYKQASALIFEGVPAYLAEIPVITDGADGVSIIEAAIQDLNKVSAENTEPLISFYQRVNLSPILNKANIVITIPNLGEIDKIRPQFLLAEAKGIGDYIAKFLKGDINSGEMMYQVDKLSIANSKKNISKTVLDTSKDITYLARQVEGENVFVDGNFIRTRLIPFLSTYPATQATLVKEANSVIAAIKDSTAMVTQTVAAANGAMSSMPKLKALKVAQLIYKVTRKFIELRSYTAFIMTRKILNYTHTMLQFYNLYTLLTERFPEGSRVLHESVIDGELAVDVEDYDLYRDMSSANGSLVDTKIESIVNRRSTDIATATRNISGSDALNQIGISYCNYNSEIYDAVKSIFSSFNSRITDFKNAIMNGEIFDDAQAHTGFDGNLTLKYNSTIANFSNVSASDFGHERAASTVPIDLAVNAFGELKNMSRNFQTIRSEMQAADANIKGIKQDFEIAKTSQTEISPETLNEAIGFMTKLYEQFQHLVVDVTKAAFQRAISLDNMIEEFLTSQTNPQGIEIHETYDEEFIPFEDLVQEFVERVSNDAEFLEMSKSYFEKRNYRNEALHTIYEETSASNASTNIEPTNTKSLGDSNNDNKKSIGWGQKLIQWIRDFFDKLTGKAEKASEAYKVYFGYFEQDIRAIPGDKYSNIESAVNVFKISSDDVVNSANNTLGKVLSVVYKQYDKTTITKAIFPQEVIPTSDNEKMSEKTRNHYINNGDGVSKESIDANVIASNMGSMIDFCKSYGTVINNINNKATETTNKLIDKAKSDGIDLTLESVFGDIMASYMIEGGWRRQQHAEKVKREKAERDAKRQAQSNASKGIKPISEAETQQSGDNKPQSPSASVKLEPANNNNKPAGTDSGKKDENDETSKLSATYKRASEDIQNYVYGVCEALKHRAIEYMQIIYAIHSSTLVDDRPSSVNDKINKYKDDNGVSFYGSVKSGDHTWNCYFYDKATLSMVKVVMKDNK